MSTKLPVLNAPRFSDKLPSTGEEFTYRPFLVKEEKYIQLTKESDDINMIYESLKSLISSCTNLEDIERLSLFDIEYIFLKLREKSVGDIIELRMKHVEDTDCDHVQDVYLDLNKIYIKSEEGHGDILLLDESLDIKLKMRYPKYKDILELEKSKDDLESILDVIINCVDMVIQGQEVFMLKDFSTTEKKEFFLSFNMTHMEIIKNFFKTMPKVCYDLEWTCSKCGKKESHVIEGVQSFLS